MDLRVNLVFLQSLAHVYFNAVPVFLGAFVIDVQLLIQGFPVDQSKFCFPLKIKTS